MPESKTDQAHRTLEEISNYHDCGDARGRGWLATHPEDQAKAAATLEQLAGLPPQQRLSAAS